MIAVWSAKGGNGASTVAALLATALAKANPTTLVDLQGDQGAVLGMSSTPTLGVAQWLAAGSGVLPQALGHLLISVDGELSLLPRGSAPSFEPLPEEAKRLVDALPNAVVDAGTVAAGSLNASLIEQVDYSVLVIRPCYLAIRRAAELKLNTTGVIVVDEPGRSLDQRDITDILGVPVLAEIALDDALARAVDAGRLLNYRGRVAKTIDKLSKTFAVTGEADVA